MPESQIINRKFGPYILIKELGIGGMAETCLAIKQGPQGVRKFVALKSILPHFNNLHEYVQMFYHEAGLGLWMNHPNVIHTWDGTEIEQRHTMVMEYLNGVTLDEIINKATLAHAPIPIDVAVWIAVTILDGLDYLHNLKDLDGTHLNVVHRDVSPQNIFACYDGHCKLFDLGVSSSALDSEMMRQGMLVGKYAYMSPEQCRGDRIDARTDIFALAIVLYEMVLARPLFARDTDIRTLDAVNNDTIQPPTSVKPDFPAYLSKIIMKGLERDMSRRYQTAHEFADDLRTFMKISGYPQTRFALSKYLKSLFNDKIIENEAFIAQALKLIEETNPPCRFNVGDSLDLCLFDDSQRSRNQKTEISFSRLQPIEPPDDASMTPERTPKVINNDQSLNQIGKIYKVLTFAFGALFILTFILLIAVKYEII